MKNWMIAVAIKIYSDKNRFNRCKLKSRKLLIQRMIEQGVMH